MRQEGKRIRTEHLEVRALASLLSHPRVGMVVPKYKRTGVERNRLKRRLREIARTRLLPALGASVPVDVVIRALPEAYAASFDQLRDEAARSVERVVRRVAGGPAS